MKIQSGGEGVYPCFSEKELRKPGSLWLPVAPACNIRCRFCHRQGQGDAFGTGRSNGNLTPEEAVARAEARLTGDGPPQVVEIAGTGEALVNASTFVVLRNLHWRYPDLTLSVWTNGLLLPDRLAELAQAGVRNLTVSLHAATPETAERIYAWVIRRARRYAGWEAAELVLQQQWNGLSDAVEAGFLVTAYIMRIDGVNDHEVPLIKARAEAIGADRVAICSFPAERS